MRPIWVAGILREGFNGVVLIDSDIGIGEEIFKFGVRVLCGLGTISKLM